MTELAYCSGTKSHISKNTGFNVKIIQNYDTEVIFTVSNILIYGFVLGVFLDCFGQKLQNFTMNWTGSVHLPACFSGTKAIYLKKNV